MARVIGSLLLVLLNVVTSVIVNSDVNWWKRLEAKHVTKVNDIIRKQNASRNHRNYASCWCMKGNENWFLSIAACQLWFLLSSAEINFLSISSSSFSSVCHRQTLRNVRHLSPHTSMNFEKSRRFLPRLSTWPQETIAVPKTLETVCWEESIDWSPSCC